MGSYRVELTRSAEKDLRRIDRSRVPAIYTALEQLSCDPRPPGVKKLAGAEQKFWLEPVRLARSGGFGRQELLDIQRIVMDNHHQLIEAWHEYFGH
jgi:mRNA-degrading endonuclease RelE of RelBE toxin-antitoxin system